MEGIQIAQQGVASAILIIVNIITGQRRTTSTLEVIKFYVQDLYFNIQRLDIKYLILFIQLKMQYVFFILIAYCLCFFLHDHILFCTIISATMLSELYICYNE